MPLLPLCPIFRCVSTGFAVAGFSFFCRFSATSATRTPSKCPAVPNEKLHESAILRCRPACLRRLAQQSAQESCTKVQFCGADPLVCADLLGRAHGKVALKCNSAAQMRFPAQACSPERGTRPLRAGRGVFLQDRRTESNAAISCIRLPLGKGAERT